MEDDTAYALAGLPRQNHPEDPGELHSELIELATGQVWQSCQPISREEFAALELEDGWRRVGVGRGAMDAHCFLRSPGAEADGPVRIREIAGRDYLHCARPASAPELPAGPAGPTRLQVDKHHVVVYWAGRTVDWLTLPDGSEFVHVVAAEPDAPALALPAGWKIETRRVEREWVLRLPTPTTVFFFPNGDSFQGPLPGFAT